MLTSWGSFGDLFPSLGMAGELKRRGHAPVIASCPFYRDLVSAEGFEFRPMRPDVDPDATAMIHRIMNPRIGTEVVVREIMAPAIRDQFSDLEAAASGADAIVNHPIVFAGPLVAERMRLPWVATVLAPISFFSAMDFPLLPNAPGLTKQLRRLGPWTGRTIMKIAHRLTFPWTAPVRELRAQLGLPPAADALYEGQFSASGTMALFSRALASPQADWPTRTTVTGFPFFNRAIPLPDALSRFLDNGDPPITFTLGTSAVGAAGQFYEESVRAVTALGKRAVLLIGNVPANRPAGPLPSSVIAVEAAPHDQLFPRSVAIVHQGGIGTTGQALRAGRPTLVVPHAHDQPDNADRVARTGGGRVLYPHRYTGPRVIDELRILLRDARIAESATATARVVQSEDGAATAADVIERLVASRA